MASISFVVLIAGGLAAVAVVAGVVAIAVVASQIAITASPISAAVVFFSGMLEEGSTGVDTTTSVNDASARKMLAASMPPGRSTRVSGPLRSTMVDSMPTSASPPSSTSARSLPRSSTTWLARVGLTRP